MADNSAYAHTSTRGPLTAVLAAVLAGVLTLWAATVVWASHSGLLGLLAPIGVVTVVGLGIAAPTLAYAGLGPVRRAVAWIGLRGLTAFHVWRIPAALVFFWFGAQGALPPIFVGLAGVGDLLAGLLALWVVTRKAPSRAAYIFVHAFGLLDFVVAVGTGVTLTLLADPLLADPLMASVTTLPLALIPFFGVALSGATHLMAFDLLRRGAVG